MIPSLLSFEWSPFAIHSFIHRPDYITITRPGVEIKYCTPLLPGVVTTLRDDCNRTIHCTYINNNNTNKSSFILSYRSITTIIQCESRLQNNVVPWTPAYKKNKTDKMTRYEMDRRKDAKTPDCHLDSIEQLDDPPCVCVRVYLVRPVPVMGRWTGRLPHGPTRLSDDTQILKPDAEEIRAPLARTHSTGPSPTSKVSSACIRCRGLFYSYKHHGQRRTSN